MGRAVVGALGERAIGTRLEPDRIPRLEEALAQLADAARAEVAGQGVSEDNITVARRVHLRYEGTDTALLVDFGSVEAMLAHAHALEAVPALMPRGSPGRKGRRMLLPADRAYSGGGQLGPVGQSPAWAENRPGQPEPDLDSHYIVLDMGCDNTTLMVSKHYSQLSQKVQHLRDMAKKATGQ